MGSPKQKQPFWLGGAAASMAVCFTHPLDQTKYRMQVLKSRTPMFSSLYRFAMRDGIPSLWSGLSASILRQSTYSTARFGLYNFFSRKFHGSSTKPTTTSTIVCAGVAGGLAGMIGNPAEVVLVRMCADGAKPPAEQFRYPNALVGLIRIWRDEGVMVFGRGLSANVVRSVLMNVAQIAPYAAAKRALLSRTDLKDDIRTHAIASLCAGTVATTVCAPADVLKSRIQAASAMGSGGLMHVIRDGLSKEGPAFLMKGWTPAWLRLTPHTVLTFVFMEKLLEVSTMVATKRSAQKEETRAIV
ncbi:mitochondrial dicarboxylate transporter [Diplogelasinospora grovesii]|uniref:Mitochondrial dicarboxylate transporter n=1 Tax=Diplogelasinospora grovesii TaxID=303347 RepID=A0AAN6N0E7_9PEZI|nr:mitochondrial dicarboxylate transporter [Diplogelasinospora grovesii]